MRRNGNNQHGVGDRPSQTQVATKAGLSRHQRKQAVRVANVPAAEFEVAIESDSPATVTALAAMGTKVQAVGDGSKLDREINEGTHISRKIAGGKFQKIWGRMGSRQIKNSKTAADPRPPAGVKGPSCSWAARSLNVIEGEQTAAAQAHLTSPAPPWTLALPGYPFRRIKHLPRL